MRTRLFHQFLPLMILLVAAVVAGAVKQVFWRHKHESSYFIAQYGPHDASRSATPYITEITGSLTGRVVDENGSPVYAIDVTVAPMGKPAPTNEGDEEELKDWTKKDGTYHFSTLTPGEYVLGVGASGAPTGERPFITSYYPGTDRKEHAEPVRVQGNMQIELRTLRLRRLPTATIKIHVRWQDGAPVESSNLLFYNPSFPEQGVIGDTAPQIANGEGEFVVPLGFEYYARAVAHCDAGAQIEARESRPVQQLRIDRGHVPQELTFVIPSQSCKLWTPR